MFTPWGISDSSERVAKGITFYGTPSHGGYKISQERFDSMPEAFRNYKPFAKHLWYEEDCDWAIVRIAFNLDFIKNEGIDRASETYTQAENTLRNWNPDTWEAFFGRKLEPEESYKRRGGYKISQERFEKTIPE